MAPRKVRPVRWGVFVGGPNARARSAVLPRSYRTVDMAWTAIRKAWETQPVVMRVPYKVRKLWEREK